MADVKIGLIGGTGLGNAFALEAGERRKVDTPFGEPSGDIIEVKWGDAEVALLQRHGDGHIFNPSQVPYRANIFAMKKLGVTHIIASGTTGSLREEVKPRDLVIIDQVIDKTMKRANTFYDNEAVHVEFAEPFCPVMRRWLLEAAGGLDGVKVHDGGTYVCMEGPAFSTKAESRMHQTMGGDLIGMTCMPEAKLAREAEIAYATIAMPTDYDCWREHDASVSQEQLLKEIIGNMEEATGNSVKLIKAALKDVGCLRENASPAHSVLKLAIWSDKGKIDAAEIEQLGVLWGKYF